MEATLIISTAVNHVHSMETVEAFADKIVEIAGSLDSAAYRSLILNWKAQYAAVAAGVRQAKVDRKGDTLGEHQSKREGFRCDARKLMAVRAALKELARRHHRAKRAAA
ncbi:hypothetical protein G6L37_05130 [Agrobacterium rubi]|nr:hypothetical protein [Agrobacterium rubi]NTF24739.1 hypothetical protein [Agrobacterium rubi]